MLRWNVQVVLIVALVALALVGPGLAGEEFWVGGFEGRGFKW
jgi:uncharacterized membrane protein YtjA (UPF0391 family)